MAREIGTVEGIVERFKVITARQKGWIEEGIFRARVHVECRLRQNWGDPAHIRVHVGEWWEACDGSGRGYTPSPRELQAGATGGWPWLVVPTTDHASVPSPLVPSTAGPGQGKPLPTVWVGDVIRVEGVVEERLGEGGRPYTRVSMAHVLHVVRHSEVVGGVGGSGGEEVSEYDVSGAVAV